jgi:hypothetical protein
MVARHWRGRSRADTASAYLDHLRIETLPRLRALDGHRGAYVLRRKRMTADYEINLDDKYGQLAVIDIAAEAAEHEPWFNQTLARVHDAVVR